MIKCIVCKEYKDRKDFGRDKRRIDFLKSYCKDCEKEKVLSYQHGKNGIVTVIYSAQKNRNKKVKTKTILVKYTKQELKEWLFSQKLFHELFNNWKNSNFESKLKPSVDRIDQNKHYELKNIQLMTWGENKNKGYIEHLGANHHMSKSKSYYETSPTIRGRFKITCKRQGWDFLDFIEIYSGEKYRTSRKYYYIYKK